VSGLSITDAVVPVAGLGTRLLPATRAVPKEMLPVAGRPVVQHVVEELVGAGIRRILLVTSRGKTAIEDHFDGDEELERAGVRLLFTRQPQPRGLGDAILRAEGFAADRPFVVALGDAIVPAGDAPGIVSRLVAAVGERGAAGAVAVEEVRAEDVSRYGIVAPREGADPAAEVFAVGEKPPAGVAPRNLAIAARYVLPPAIFGALRATPPGARGEVQLTDALRQLLVGGEEILGVRLRERRFDVGTPEGYRAAFLELDERRPG
jgi:UTP--glucose-1-phosphate uridylyltransferase